MTDRSIEDGMKGVHSRPAHNGIKGVLTSVYKEGGVRGLYRGAGMYVTISTNATFMLGKYNWFLAENSLEFLFVGNMFSYGMSQLSSLAFHCLILFFFFSTFIENINFFFFLGPTLTGILPYAGLKFYMYEKLKMHVPEEHQKSILMRLSCGALAGLFGQTLTYPLDVVKRQMQVLAHNFMSSAGQSFFEW